MVFSSPIFLFLFLPLVLFAYLLTPRALKNTVLLGASLVFYAWGEGPYTVVMLGSILVNYLAGLVLMRFEGRVDARRRALAAIVGLNLALLIAFKYANFLANNLNILLQAAGLPLLNVPPVHLPIGISFFTFHAISYVVDVYRGEARAQRNPINVALYVTLFPQLIAGPILRYHDLAGQLGARPHTTERFAYGVRRFIAGLGKKVLIANTLALPADQIFALAPEHLAPGVAWLGIVCYALQIYFDFSGYSDMAVGLGAMFGFRIMENFEHPYVATSMREFWRRWHISLSTWFRDYLYIPLGGSRGGAGRTVFNLVTVFFLCGLWHGASWTFILWGLLHGFFLMIERLGVEDRLRRAPRVLQHVYVLLVLVLTWTFFRAESFGAAVHFLGMLCGVNSGALPQSVAMHATPAVWLALGLGIVCATPLGVRVHAAVGRTAGYLYHGAVALGLAAIFLLATISMASGTYNPFIYFRF